MISKFYSICFCHTRFPQIMLLCFIPLLSIILQPCPGHGEKYEGIPIIQKDARGQVKHYKTALGELKAGMLILKGSQILPG